MRRRLLVSLIVVVLIALSALGLRSGAVAQDTSTEGHPLVGTWLADTETEDDEGASEVFIFTSDGGYTQVDPDGEVLLGAWEATGANTANLTIVSYETDENGDNAGSIKVRASIEVGADGDSFTAQYTLEVTDPDGASMGEAGPASATGTRLQVEAPGTPVMTMDELFGALEGTPEATPAS
jgi:hypothetical protein